MVEKNESLPDVCRRRDRWGCVSGESGLAFQQLAPKRSPDKSIQSLDQIPNHEKLPHPGLAIDVQDHSLEEGSSIVTFPDETMALFYGSGRSGGRRRLSPGPWDCPRCLSRTSKQDNLHAFREVQR
jgi:hypothetical protein